MTTPTVRKTKRADELKPGDRTIDLASPAAKVLSVHPYTDLDDRVMVIYEDVDGFPATLHLMADTPLELATDEELAELREVAERAKRIADIRALADWLEANPWVPMPYYISGYESFDDPDEAANVAKVRELAARLNLTVDDRLDDRTGLTKSFGRAEYKLFAWHKYGRPAEPASAPTELLAIAPSADGGVAFALAPAGSVTDPVARAKAVELAEAVAADPTGLAYTRADSEADDPTPVSPARVPLHTGAMVDGDQLVDETEAVTRAAITEACVITGWGKLCTTHQARHVATSMTECGCPVFPFAGRGDAADTIIDHRLGCPTQVAEPDDGCPRDPETGKVRHMLECAEDTEQRELSAWPTDADPVHMDFVSGEAVCGLPATTPHKASLVWAEVTCQACVDQVGA